MKLVKRVVLRKIETHERDYLSSELELDELEVAMKELKNEHRTGPNGLSVELYKKMSIVVSPTYLKNCP